MNTEPRFWGDVSLPQLHEMLGTEHQSVEDLDRVSQVLDAQATLLRDAAAQHDAAWAERLAYNNDTALVAADRAIAESRLELNASADLEADMSAGINRLTEQFVHVRAEVARLYRESAELESPQPLGWLVEPGPQWIDAEVAAKTAEAQRLMQEYDRDVCEALRRWQATIVPSTSAQGIGQLSSEVSAEFDEEDTQGLDQGSAAVGTSVAFAGSDADTVPRHVPGAAVVGRCTPPPVVPPRTDPLTDPVPRTDSAGVGSLGISRLDGGDEQQLEWRLPNVDRPRTIFDPDWDGVPPVIGGVIDHEEPRQ